MSATLCKICGETCSTGLTVPISKRTTYNVCSPECQALALANEGRRMLKVIVSK